MVYDLYRPVQVGFARDREANRRIYLPPPRPDVSTNAVVVRLVDPWGEPIGWEIRTGSSDKVNWKEEGF